MNRRVFCTGAVATVFNSPPRAETAPRTLHKVPVTICSKGEILVSQLRLPLHIRLEEAIQAAAHEHDIACFSARRRWKLDPLQPGARRGEKFTTGRMLGQLGRWRNVNLADNAPKGSWIEEGHYWTIFMGPSQISVGGTLRDAPWQETITLKNLLIGPHQGISTSRIELVPTIDSDDLLVSDLPVPPQILVIYTTPNTPPQG